MWCAKSDVVWRKSEGALVLLNTTSGLYYTINPTGALLWISLVEKQQTFDQAIGEIREQCEEAPDPATIRGDCEKLLEQWKAENLIEEKPGADAKA